MRKLTFALMLALLFGFAAAQNPTVDPTDGTGDDFVDTGTTEASVNQTVTLRLPEATALHITADNLVFDIADINNSDSSMVCVYGDNGGADDYSGLADLSPRGTQVYPLGTYYLPDGAWTATELPTIKIMDYEKEVTSYPPYEIVNGELVPGSKKYFVCYKSFILQKFSNGTSWELSVMRSSDPSGGNTFDMYIQDNSFCSFNNDGNGDGNTGDDATGLFELPVGATVSLLPDAYTSDTTGALAAACGDQHKSWLDDLVVIAVKVNGEAAGDNVATLTYTLTSPDPTQ